MNRFVSYLRISTDSQGRSGLGLDAQRQAVAAHIAVIGGQLAPEFQKIERGKFVDRPQLGTVKLPTIDQLREIAADLGMIMSDGELTQHRNALVGEVRAMLADLAQPCRQIVRLAAPQPLGEGDAHGVGQRLSGQRRHRAGLTIVGDQVGHVRRFVHHEAIATGQEMTIRYGGCETPPPSRVGATRLGDGRKSTTTRIPRTRHGSGRRSGGWQRGGHGCTVCPRGKNRRSTGTPGGNARS